MTIEFGVNRKEVYKNVARGRICVNCILILLKYSQFIPCKYIPESARFALQTDSTFTEIENNTKKKQNSKKNFTTPMLISLKE